MAVHHHRHSPMPSNGGLLLLLRMRTILCAGCFLLLFSAPSSLVVLAHDSALPVNCYRNNGADLQIEEVRCAPSLPTSPTYCLKATVYDGRVIRDCASSAQCPQGDACAPITYQEDGTTDFVCCCSDDLCNSALPQVNRRWLILFLPLLMILLAFLLTDINVLPFIF